jgi:uncharacterized protein
VTHQKIEIDAKKVAEVCRRHGVKRLSLFGSVLRDDFGPASDVDMLVEFQPKRAPGWIGFARLALELEEVIGREVDLRTPADLSVSIRSRAVSESEVQYAA